MESLKPTYANGRLAKVGDVVLGPFYANSISTPSTCLVTYVQERVADPPVKDRYPDFDLQVITIRHGQRSKETGQRAVTFILISDLVPAIPTIPICDEPFKPVS